MDADGEDCAASLCSLPAGHPHRSATNRSNNMSDYQIIDTNADNIGGCSLCGNKNANNLGLRRKTNWLKERYLNFRRYSSS